MRKFFRFGQRTLTRMLKLWRSGESIICMYSKSNMYQTYDCEPFERNWLTWTVNYTNDFETIKKDWMVGNMNYSYDFEANGNLFRKQSVLLYGTLTFQKEGVGTGSHVSDVDWGSQKCTVDVLYVSNSKSLRLCYDLNVSF